GRVRLREVPVVVCLLLAAFRHRDTLRLDPAASLLNNSAARAHNLNLPLCLVLQRPLYRAEAVHILDLRFDTQRLLPAWTNRDIGGAAQASFLHTPRRHT